jgi:hypothetical protein
MGRHENFGMGRKTAGSTDCPRRLRLGGQAGQKHKGQDLRREHRGCGLDRAAITWQTVGAHGGLHLAERRNGNVLESLRLLRQSRSQKPVLGMAVITRHWPTHTDRRVGTRGDAERRGLPPHFTSQGPSNGIVGEEDNATPPTRIRVDAVEMSSIHRRPPPLRELEAVPPDITGERPLRLPQATAQVRT